MTLTAAHRTHPFHRWEGGMGFDHDHGKGGGVGTRNLDHIYMYSIHLYLSIYIYIYPYSSLRNNPLNARPQPVELAFLKVTELIAYPTGLPLCLPLDSSGFGA